jgi:hypothetical protein
MLPVNLTIYSEANAIYNRRTGQALASGQSTSFTVKTYDAVSHQPVSGLEAVSGVVESPTRAYAELPAVNGVKAGERYDGATRSR